VIVAFGKWDKKQKIKRLKCESNGKRIYLLLQPQMKASTNWKRASKPVVIQYKNGW
jgi:hypothetical protein